MVELASFTYESAAGLKVSEVTIDVAVDVNVDVAVGVNEGVAVTVGVRVMVGVLEGVAVGPTVAVAVGVPVSVGVLTGPVSVSMRSCGAFAPASRLARLISVEFVPVSTKLKVPFPVI